MPIRPVRSLCLLILLASALLSGCATYHALRLDNGRGQQRVADIKVPVSSMPTPALRTYRFDPSNGLDVAETAMLAVANNPKLKVQRDAAGVAHAQAYQAGLLPDPQLSYQHQHPTRPQGSATNSFTGGLTLNLGSLVTRSARVASARAGARKVDLNLLWSEWQTIAKARTLFDDVYYLRRLTARLQREQSALMPIQASITQALQAGDLTYASASAGLNAASNVANQLSTTQRQLHLAERDLHDLLGLDTSVPLRLTGAPFSVDPDAAQVRNALTDMTQRRPDLLALQAGYKAQQETVRAAILAQFPAITVGLVRESDNGGISSAGFSIGLSLPLFDGNRGKIAIARATRQQLHDTYTVRLLTGRNDIQRLLADLASDRAQLKALVAHAAQLAQARQAAASNYAAGRLAWPTYLAIRASSLSTDTTLLTLRQNTHTTAIALDALVGNWPDAAQIKGEH